MQYILDNTRPETLALEPDLGWMEVGGGDCAWYLATYRDRCPVIPPEGLLLLGQFQARAACATLCPRAAARTAATSSSGPRATGVLNLPKLMPLCLSCEPAWFVMDHDLAYERDPYEDLKLSLDYTRALLKMQA